MINPPSGNPPWVDSLAPVLAPAILVYAFLAMLLSGSH